MKILKTIFIVLVITFSTTVIFGSPSFADDKPFDPGSKGPFDPDDGE